MVGLQPIPKAWPRVFNILGVGFLFLAWVAIMAAKADAIFFEATMAKIAAVNSATTSIAALFVAYIGGEVFCGVGRGIPTRRPSHLAIVAMVKFCATDNTGYWIGKLNAADARSELFRGLGSAISTASFGTFLHLCLLSELAVAFVTLLLGLIVAYISYSIAFTSYSEIETAMDEFLEFKQT